MEVLQRTQDEELLYYLLQLVQALRYEATTHSRLSAFLVSRATKNTVMGTLLHWQAPLATRPPTAACPSFLVLVSRLRPASYECCIPCCKIHSKPDVTKESTVASRVS